MNPNEILTFVHSFYSHLYRSEEADEVAQLLSHCIVKNNVPIYMGFPTGIVEERYYAPAS